MRQLPFIAAAAITLMAATPVVGLIATPAAAQEWRGADRDRGDGELRELLREVLMDGGMERRQGRRQERREDRRDDRRNDLRSMLLDHLGDDDADGRLPERVRSLRDRDDDGRGRLRERVHTLRDQDDDDDGAGRSRLRQRIAERRNGGCYFLTRSLRDEDGDLLVTVRRRRCPD